VVYAAEVLNYMPHNATPQTQAYGDPTGATGDVNVLHLRDSAWYYSILGAGQTKLAPSLNGSLGAIDIGLDVDVSEGVEYIPGALTQAKNPFAVTIGTSPNAGFRATLRVTDITGLAELALGWRKAENFQALIDNYDEMAAINVQLGTVNRETILNGAATVTVDTGETVVNDTSFSLEVRLVGRGARMFLNDEELSIGAAFNFDVGEVVVPFLHFLQAGGANSGLYAYDYEVGPLYVSDLDPARR
jgi:hypothetical protein